MSNKTKFLFGLIPLLASIPFVSAQGGTTCNVTTPCPASAPCCSEYGFCGSGTFCLGGCDPLASNTVTSCMPEPVCQNAVHKFNDTSRILSNATYFGGNATAYDWVVDKGSVINGTTSGEIALILTEDNGGTRLSSTRYIHYGTITTRLKAGRWSGVVAAFITMSDIKDEIDWEFPGNATNQGQTNFFWQGVIPATTAGNTTSISPDTFDNYHDYTIDWKPDSLSWAVDNTVVRTIQASDLVDSTGVSRFPNTPSRIQLSIWPAGINSSAPGTVQWAGGMINWNDPDYVAAGHFYTLIQSVTITCADPTSAGAGTTSYVYGKNTSALTPSVAFSNLTTINGARGVFGVDGVAGLRWSVVGALLLALAGAFV